MEEISTVLGLLKEVASLIVMAWLVLRSRKGMKAADTVSDHHQVHAEMLAELADLPGVAKALRHLPDASEGVQRNISSGNHR